MAALLSVNHINKTYQKKFKALTNISLDVMQGEFIALLGPSGCGKTTLLATLAGFLAPDSGTIHIDGKDLTDVPPYKRPLNTVFQNYALFPHMSVLDNVSYGPLRAGTKKPQARKKALEALDMVGLAQMADRYPADMSGGQRQRVALARAIVNQPKLLLLDEPLSALDMKLRKRMQRELKELQKKLAISFIFVTHDQEEAMAMADRIVVMNQGIIEQVGTGDEIYRHPANRFVAEFIGDANLLECQRQDGQLRLKCCGAPLTQATVGDQSLTAVIRPESIEVIRVNANDPASPDIYHARVLDTVSIGSHTTIYTLLNDTPIEVRRMGTNDLNLQQGETIGLRFPSDSVHLIGA